jgi:opacity protein-like surface antigen
VRRLMIAGLAGAAMLAAGGAQAGTKGALYDIRVFLYEPHPFAHVPNPFTNAGLALAPARAPQLPADVFRQPMAPAPVYRMPPQSSAAPPPPPPAGYAPPPTIRSAPPLPPPVVPRPYSQNGQMPGQAPMAQAPAGRSPDNWPPAAQPELRPATMAASDGDFVSRLFDRTYFSFTGGVDFASDLGGKTSTGASFTSETDPGYMLGLAFGRYYDDNVRAELELAFRQADYGTTTIGGVKRNGGDISVTTFMVNGYYGFRWDPVFVPYIGAGLGMALLDGTDVTVGAQTAPGRDSTEFAYQGILGLSYRFQDGINIGVEGRYLGTSDDDVSSGTLGVNARFDL